MVLITNVSDKVVELTWGSYVYKIEPGEKQEVPGKVVRALQNRFQCIEKCDPVVKPIENIEVVEEFETEEDNVELGDIVAEPSVEVNPISKNEIPEIKKVSRGRPKKQK